MYMYIYIYIEREREIKRERAPIQQGPSLSDKQRYQATLLDKWAVQRPVPGWHASLERGHVRGYVTARGTAVWAFRSRRTTGHCLSCTMYGAHRSHVWLEGDVLFQR